MKKNILSCLLILLIIPQIVFAEDVLSLYLDVYKNDTVILEELKIIPGKPTQYMTPGDYTLQITDVENKIIFEKSIGLNFLIMTDPPTPTDTSYINIRIIYEPQMSNLKLLHGENEIFSKKIVICNNDGICENFESYLSCPSDCPLSSIDGICINDRDGVCDPDCTPGADSDCITTITEITTTTIQICNKNKKCESGLGENYKTCPKDCSSGSGDGYCDGKPDGICDSDCNKEDDIDCMKLGNNLLIYGLVFGVVVVLVLVIVIKSRKPV
jgi:hypothetical protein